MLILSVALALGFGSAAHAASSRMSAEQHDVASIQHGSRGHDTGTQAPCHDQITDCCPSPAHCGSSGHAIFVAPAGASAFAYSRGRTWASATERCLKGLDPLVNPHPPRDRA